MWLPGLTTVTFRDKDIDTIARHASRCGLTCVEVGGDVHAPYVCAAKKARESVIGAGLKISSFGSYYVLGGNNDFRDTVAVAATLGAPLIRVWCGNRSPSDTSDELYGKIVADAVSMCRYAEPYGIKIGLECHNKTLTENKESALGFLNAVGHENLCFYWQPNQFASFEENLEAAKATAFKTEAIHVFHWSKDTRFPLANGEREWKQYLSVFASQKRDIPLLLEFLFDDKLESLAPETNTLLSWL